MIKLRILSSSSLGNLYLIQSDTETLIIEAGLPLKEIKKVLDFDLSSVVGCVASHSHQDHSKYIKQYLEAGIMCYSSFDCLAQMNVQFNHFSHPIEPEKPIKIGSFTVLPFALVHDVTCYGFLIQHDEMGKLLFVTDTSSIPYSFTGLRHILIECNYSADIIDEKVVNHPYLKRIGA